MNKIYIFSNQNLKNHLPVQNTTVRNSKNVTTNPRIETNKK